MFLPLHIIAIKNYLPAKVLIRATVISTVTTTTAIKASTTFAVVISVKFLKTTQPDFGDSGHFRAVFY